MAKQQRTLGAFLKIILPNEKSCYARILKNASYAFYDLITDELVDTTEVSKREILFIIACYDNVVTSGRWAKIGKLSLEEQLMRLPLKFIQDTSDTERFELYDPNTGEIRTAKKSECLGLERAAVWEAEHVESRIVDYYAGRPNQWLEQMRIK